MNKDINAIGIVRQMVADGQISQEVAEKYFPELKESDDEKTKRLLHTIANKMSQHLRDIFTEEEYQCFDAWSNAWLEKQGEQKSAEWSEEDERMLKAISIALTLKSAEGYLKSWHITPEEADNWLKSLMPQSHWKPSDEQMNALESIFAKHGAYDDDLLSLISDLKKLREE